MAARSFIDSNFSLVKKMTHLFTAFSVSGTTPSLLKWNYPALQPSTLSRTYTAATTAANVGAGAWPKQAQSGAEGVYGVTRTAAGLYTLKLQDNYERLVFVDGYASVAGGTPVFAKVTENTTISSYQASGGSVVGLAFWDYAGVAVDPIGQLNLMLVLADSSAP